jgi:lipoate-protein ligase A
MKNQSRFTKIAVASGLIVASGAAVLGITGFASAELAPKNNAAVVAPAADDNGGVSGQAIDGAAAPAGLPADKHTPISRVNTAKALGLTETELQTQLQTKSFATIAKEQGKDIADVKAAILADLKAHLAEEVASGEHTQAEADAKLAQATANIDTLVNNVGRPGGKGMGGPQVVTDALAKVLKLSTTELQTQLQTKSFATIAKEQGVDIADVKAQLLKDYTDKENAEVATGEHTQAEVDAKIAAFKANLDTMVNNVGPQGGRGMGGDHGPRGGAPKFATDALAKVLKLSTTELNTQLQSGKTLADIAKTQNVDIADVKAQLLKDYTDKENAEVATGEHTQAEVDAKIADFKTRLDDIVNGVRPAGGPGMGGKGMRGGHGHGHMEGDGPMGMNGQNGGPLGGTAQTGSTQNAGFSA